MGTTTVNISFQDKLLSDLDKVAKSESRCRSELLREAARMYIERKRRWEKIFGYGKTQAAQKKLTPDDITPEISFYRKQKSRT